MSLRDYMREQRKKKNWSQRDLAAAADVSNAEISRIESGKRKSPSPTVLKAIARALDVPVAKLYQEAGIIEDGKKIVDDSLGKYGDTTISDVDQGQKKTSSSGFSANSSMLEVSDLSKEEIADVKKYIAFIKSLRK